MGKGKEKGTGLIVLCFLSWTNSRAVVRATRGKLHDLAEMLEVCDENGRVLGYFSPVIKQDHPLYEGAQAPVADEEVQKLLQQPPGRPLKDVLADLE